MMRNMCAVIALRRLLPVTSRSQHCFLQILVWMELVGENLNKESGRIGKSRPFAVQYAKVSLNVCPVSNYWTRTTSGIKLALVSTQQSTNMYLP